MNRVLIVGVKCHNGHIAWRPIGRQGRSLRGGNWGRGLIASGRSPPVNKLYRVINAEYNVVRNAGSCFVIYAHFYFTYWHSRWGGKCAIPAWLYF